MSIETLPEEVSLPLKDRFEEVLEKLLRAYSGYYNIKRESSVPAFCAEAEFHLHNEQYFLVKAAKLSESETKETIFFAKTDVLDTEKAASLAAKAWEEGLSRITPGPNHRCSDVSLVILAGGVTPDAAELIKKNKEVKSYRFGLYGYSHFRMVAFDLSKSVVVRNKMGDTLEKVICDIFFKSKEERKK